MLLLSLVLLPFAGSLCAALLPSNARNLESWLAGLIAFACAALAAAAYPEVAGGGVVRYALPWVPSLGLEFSLRMDGLAWLFVMLISVIGTLVVM